MDLRELIMLCGLVSNVILLPMGGLIWRMNSRLSNIEGKMEYITHRVSPKGKDYQ